MLAVLSFPPQWVRATCGHCSDDLAIKVIRMAAVDQGLGCAQWPEGLTPACPPPAAEEMEARGLTPSPGQRPGRQSALRHPPPFRMNLETHRWACLGFPLGVASEAP